MSKKRRPSAPASAGPAQPGRAVRVAGLLVALAAAVALGAFGPQAWRWNGRVDRIQAHLPAAPDLAGRPAELVALITEARAHTSTRATALDGLVQLARLYHANGFSAAAEACWHQLQLEQPREPRWPYYQAELRRIASDNTALEALLARTVALAPGYAPAWLQLAELAFKSGRFDEAAAHYERRLQLLPVDPYASLGIARIAIERGQHDAARRMLEALVRASPEFSAAHNLYAELLAATGDSTGAQHHRWSGREAGRFREPPDPWLEELNTHCHDPRRLRLLGTIAYQTNQTEAAQRLLTRSVALAPDDAVGQELLGDFFLKSGKPGQARIAYEAALRSPVGTRPSVVLLVNLSTAYRQLEQPDAALRVLRDGLIHSPDAFELHNALGSILEEAGNLDAAIAAYRRALTHNPSDADTNLNLGLALLAQGRREAAQAAFKNALTAQPSFPKALFMLGGMELEAGNLEAAGAYLHPLYQYHPEQPNVRTIMAQWHLAAGLAAADAKDVARAERHYRDGVAADPEIAQLHASLGVLCLMQGRPKDALASLEAYHRLQPGNPQSALFLGQAYAQLGRRSDARRVLTEAERLATQNGSSSTAEFCREILRTL